MDWDDTDSDAESLILDDDTWEERRAQRRQEQMVDEQTVDKQKFSLRRTFRKFDNRIRSVFR